MALPAERRAALVAAKLGALVAGQAPGVAPATAVPRAGMIPGGAALVVDGRAWVLLDEDPGRGLGPALAWADGQGLDGRQLDVVADDESAAGALARRASAFVDAPRVWWVEGAQLRSAVAAPPARPPDPVVPDGARDLARVLAAHGVDVVVDHGQVIGEVAGLEVARVVLDEGGEARLEVGVGRHDREAFAIIHADASPDAALDQVVATVAAQRRPGAPPHPLNRLGAQRWLRAHLVDQPHLAGAADLVAVAGLGPRPGVKDTSAVAALGTDDAGQPLLVVTSVGIDLDLVPAVADLRLAHAPAARLVLAVPARDAHPVTRRLAERLGHPAEVVAVPDSWRA